jgi:RNA polymerase sigma-70 factor, ECF subfamily
VSALFRAAKTDFDRLYRRHVSTVYRYAYAVLGNHADAEDVTQQTFLNAYRAISEGTKPRKTENWLLTIAHNEVRRHFRRAQAKPTEVELDEEVADHSAERSEPSLADVVRALQHLPPIQRSALVMREFEGRSYKEIAGILDVTQSALEALVFRARRALAEQLEGALTCTEAEQAVSRRLDGRLPRREAHRLKAHLRECPLCVRFATVQKRQRSLLKGFSIMPIPASLFLFRGEHAAAAGFGGGAAAGGSTAAAGIGTAFAAKAAAVTATIGVAGGVGYTVNRVDPPMSAEPQIAQAKPAASTSRGDGVTAVAREPHPTPNQHVALRRSAKNTKALPAKARAVKHKASRGANKPTVGPSRAHGVPAGFNKARPAKLSAGRPSKPAQPMSRTKVPKRLGTLRPKRIKPPQPTPKPAKSKLPRDAEPGPPPKPERRGSGQRELPRG